MVVFSLHAKLIAKDGLEPIIFTARAQEIRANFRRKAMEGLLLGARSTTAL